ncbi:TCR/Tet family MFS transporter [Roseobacter sp. HKCCA0434]|uniref:TCR/Tet family MFS transporter n=1 Tax=Roseobacter sp. HKCCA0434 TaxID=3079297 RepID=UPI002905EFC7|nr:TCR/Tet family MFS transporter [Roseobacter sp. HKCCA0434]
MPTRFPLIFVTLTMMLDAMGIGLILPVMPELLRQLEGGTISQAAVWGGALAMAYAAMQFLFSPLVGNLSDRFGRRPVLLVSLVAMGLNYLLMALAGSVWWLFAARIVSGITGATYATANAVVADITPPERRAANFGLVGAAFGAGFVLGPAIGGLLGEFGPRAPFFAAAALALGNAAFGYFAAPETLRPDRRRPLVWAEANPVRALMRARALPGIADLLTVFLIYLVASNVYPVIWAFFTIEKFGWSEGLVGLSLSFFGICMALVQALLIRALMRRFTAPAIATWGFVINIVVFALLVVVPDTFWLFVFLPLCALGAIVTPAIQSLLANATEDDRQGALQGVIGALQAISQIITPIVMPLLFRAFTAEDAPVYLPSAPFVAAGLLTAIALILFLRRRLA